MHLYLRTTAIVILIGFNPLYKLESPRDKKPNTRGFCKQNVVSMLTN